MSTRNLSIENLNVWYGDRRILHDVTLDIPDRQITAIIGPSGCGKTTLMRCMNRLLEVNTDSRIEGKVLVDGRNIYDPGTEVTSIRKKMGLLSQRPQVLPMSIYDNVAYGLRIHGLRKKSELDRIVEKNLRACSLWDEVSDRLNSPATGLSIGQQQRLCLARGLAVEPEIILGDEPTSALDPQASQNIEQLLVQLKKDYTIVLVTHILRQAKRIADHVVFLYMGKVIETGPTGDVLNNPREELTKRYIAGVIS
ncbi:MAG TPA: phosphate ABC transporter ATP-binding protein [Kiritimatiellia bacterium]|nr:phosphate ABC transporter ATP-binding protein [Kiritimatiellia bacterium]HNR94288.1 phosphate ABC transporter ATP-binding protein [Kiritimatiellia bacterium]HPA77524.1 phosphate ABC transporter ATP-binding protein [Kiritimatiellia bacterium]HQQ04799.1 phosphate ABC transporter ATP-binding protein [Kiritimatiellia bacterium]